MIDSAAYRGGISVYPPCGMHGALAGIAGRTAQAQFSPGVEIGKRVDDPPAELAVDWPGAVAAVLFERASGEPEMHGSIGRPQETSYNWSGSGIHGLAPLGFEHSGGLPLVAEINGEAQAFGGSDRMGGAFIVTPPHSHSHRAASGVAQELAVAAIHKAAGFGNQPEHMAAFTRSLPVRPGKRAMIWHDQVKCDIARRCAGIKRVAEGKQLCEARALVAVRHCGPVGRDAATARGPLKAGSSGETCRAAGIAVYDQTTAFPGRCRAKAKAKPRRAVRHDKMVIGIDDGFSQGLTVRRKPDRAERIWCFQDDHVGSQIRRPECGAGPRVRIGRGGESSAPTARPDPPFPPVRSRGDRRYAPRSRQSPAGSQDCAARTPARNPRSRDVDTDLRSMMTAMTNHRT